HQGRPRVLAHSAPRGEHARSGRAGRARAATQRRPQGRQRRREGDRQCAGAGDDARARAARRRPQRLRRPARGGRLVTTAENKLESLAILLRALKLPTIARLGQEVAQQAEREGWTFQRYLHHLAELEVEERRRKRIARFQKQSELPGDKTLATLNRSRLPPKVGKQLAALCE